MTTSTRPRGLKRSDVKVQVQRLLRERRHVEKSELVQAIRRTSSVTVQRVLNELQYEGFARWDGGTKRWHTCDHVSGVLEVPEAADLVAVLVAEALVSQIVPNDLRERLRALSEELDEKLRTAGHACDRPRPHAVYATSTLGTKVDAGVLKVLLRAVRRRVLEIDYAQPWAEPPRCTTRTIEPLLVRFHDGALYLRSYDRDRKEVRTFRVAHIERVRECTGEALRAPPDAYESARRDDDPAYGVDVDRPDTAAVRLRGPVARWLHQVVWHPSQRDTWLEPNQLLERRLPYHSCREMARRVLSVLDAVESIDPPTLREEVESAMARYASRRDGTTDDAAAKRQA